MEKQEAIIAQQQTEMRTVMARLNEQAAQIQKVCAQVKANSYPAGTIVRNP
jgi:hypothetical protein